MIENAKRFIIQYKPLQLVNAYQIYNEFSVKYAFFRLISLFKKHKLIYTHYSGMLSPFEKGYCHDK